MANKTKAKAKAKAAPMTKAKLVAHLADKFELSRKMAADLINEFADLAVTETKKRGQFVIPGIGKLVKAQRKARAGVNPKTKEKIQIPAKTVVKFRVAKACKDAVSPSKK